MFYDPVTGFNKNPTTFGRPNPNFGPLYNVLETSSAFGRPNRALVQPRSGQLGLRLSFYPHADVACVETPLATANRVPIDLIVLG